MPVLLPSPSPTLTLRRRVVWCVHRWHLLSLDAPTVATLWTGFIARTAGLHLPPRALLSMFLAVWILYVADRLLDARLLTSDPLLPRSAAPSELEARHLFHHRHRRAFLSTLVLATLALGLLLPGLPSASLHLFVLLGSLLVGYFVLIHASPAAAHLPGSLQRLPKELAVGPFFAAACFIPTIARWPHLRSQLWPAALLFAALCSLNCLVIYSLEHHPQTQAHGSEPHALTRFALRHLRALAGSLLLAASLLALRGPVLCRIPALATLLATLCLLALERASGPRRPTLSRLTARSLADLALTTPLLFLLLRP